MSVLLEGLGGGGGGVGRGRGRGKCGVSTEHRATLHAPRGPASPGSAGPLADSAVCTELWEREDKLGRSLVDCGTCRQHH